MLNLDTLIIEFDKGLRTLFAKRRPRVLIPMPIFQMQSRGREEANVGAAQPDADCSFAGIVGLRLLDPTCGAWSYMRGR